ncbi:30S ribosomal protein S3 [Candidatus Dependentiae bacterium]|nr:30S ribosomal protein S3 [Candidatus Dependentiae bacterium]MBU4387585.1 30S ribosomal protein S3 [Candidatus Dependentiae bacterium]MCG2756293.1 30S ribosomal protein S3 [Candidatus Dependentiae bacterium]
MGQKVHPVGFRLGVFEDWRARWFSKKSYGKELLEDLAIRKYLKSVLNFEDIDKIVIEKAGDNIRIILHSSRPGFIIGKKGMGIEKLKSDFYNKFKKNVEFSVQEVKNPDLSAAILAKSIADQLLKRVSFKRAMKKAGFAAMKSGAKGIKVCCAGRLGGAEIARTEWLRLGSVPLHTLRSNIDYSLAEAKTTYGIIGIKVWVCKGSY